MTRTEIYEDIRSLFGEVPNFFEKIPDSSLELEWKLLKTTQFEDGAVPHKYRALIGIAVAAVKGCPYCTYFYTETAKLNGATEAEIEDAVRFAKSTVSWSIYLYGLEIPIEEFRDDVRRIAASIRSRQAGNTG